MHRRFDPNEEETRFADSCRKKYNIKKRCAQNYRIIHARGGVRLKYEDIKCCDAWIKKVLNSKTQIFIIIFGNFYLILFFLKSLK